MSLSPTSSPAAVAGVIAKNISPSKTTTPLASIDSEQTESTAATALISEEDLPTVTALGSSSDASSPDPSKSGKPIISLTSNSECRT